MVLCKIHEFLGISLALLPRVDTDPVDIGGVVPIWGKPLNGNVLAIHMGGDYSGPNGFSIQFVPFQIVCKGLFSRVMFVPLNNTLLLHFLHTGLGNGKYIGNFPISLHVLSWISWIHNQLNCRFKL